MDQIKYIKVHKDLNAWAGPKSRLYNFSSKLTKGVDCSNLKKRNKSLLESLTEEYKRLEKAHVHAQDKVEANKTVSHNIEMHKREIVYLTHEIEKIQNLYALMQASALRIQRVARGYLARRWLENVNFM
jgi:septation ring formation regulator EzrA